MVIEPVKMTLKLRGFDRLGHRSEVHYGKNYWY